MMKTAWQMIPLVVLAVAMLASVVMLGTRARAPAIRLFRGAMLLLMLSGATGTVLHYRANMEFKLEMDPSLSGFALFSSVVRAKAPPALAPGNMALLGLLGLACRVSSRWFVHFAKSVTTTGAVHMTRYSSMRMAAVAVAFAACSLGAVLERAGGEGRHPRRQHRGREGPAGAAAHDAGHREGTAREASVRERRRAEHVPDRASR